MSDQPKTEAIQNSIITPDEGLSVDQKAVIAKSESQKLIDKAQLLQIRGPKNVNEATELLAIIQNAAKSVKAAEDSIILPAKLSIKNAQSLFANPKDNLKKAQDLVKAKMVNFHQKEEAKAAEKQRQLDAQKAAATAAGQEPPKTPTAPAPVPAKTVKTESGASTTFRKERRVRIIDIGALPPEYFGRERVLEALRIEVSNDVLKAKKPVPPGAEEYFETIAAGRS